MREWVARLAGRFQKRKNRERLEFELELHRELVAEHLAATGSDSNPTRELGSASYRDDYYDRAGVPWIENLWSDLRYGFRSMRRTPSFSLILIFTLALGIGVNTAIFSLVHGVLLKPLPYPDPERLVWLGESTGRAAGISITWVNFRNWQAANHSFESMAAFQFVNLTLTGRQEALMTRGLAAGPEYFGLLGMHPLLGRLYGETDNRAGAAPVVVLNHRFWSGKLGGDPNIVGTTVMLDGKAYEVAGVAAPVWESAKVDYYLPVGLLHGTTVDRGRHGSIRAVARLRPGVTLETARADLDEILQHLAKADPGSENEHRSYGEFLSEHATGSARGTLLMLMGAAALVLLIACSNAASLLLARGTTRLSEFAVRTAIGAGRARLTRQLLTENLLIAATGGLAGVALAYWTLRVLLSIAPIGIPRLAETSLDMPVLLFAFGIILTTGLVTGIAPIVAAGKIDLTSALKFGARSSGGSRRGGRTSSAPTGRAS